MTDVNDEVLTKRDGHIVVIPINRPAARNALGLGRP
jgi:enoyl-CoA hydratase/carnithine racemase